MKIKYAGISLDTALGTSVTPESFIRSHKGTVTGKVDREAVKLLIPNRRKLVLTFDEATMNMFRGHSPGEMLTMTGFPQYLGKNFKIVRRDWKRCRVHLIEEAK